ncbi:MAG: ATP-binding protein [Bacteroidia bacterium]|nr:ATP-binding protein [Bacteroidia bacterium]MCF8446691.1 ATP-binding protein [Bacteroidia bacterium]
MSYEKLFNLKSNPFRHTPAISSTEIIWAGFPLIKEKFHNRIKRAIKVPNSSLILNWGEYGSGKTHAARYFGKKTVLAEISEEAGGKIPYFIFVTLPKGKSPIEDFYTTIVDKLDISLLRASFNSQKEDLINYIDLIGDNGFIKNVAKAFFNDEIEENLFRRYLYGSANATDNRSLSERGIQRVLNPDTDYSKLLSVIFSCLTFNGSVYSSVILWIDEFEDIAILTKVNGDKTNSFLRELLDNTPNNLLIFLNLTQSALFNIEDLGEYISEALKSRIKDRINFELPKEPEILTYVSELLKAYKVEDINDTNIYSPFNETLLQQILKDLGNVSIRNINEALGTLVDLAESDSKSPIDLEYYKTNLTDVIGWKN